MKFFIDRYFSRCDTFEVEADSYEEAVQKIYDEQPPIYHIGDDFDVVEYKSTLPNLPKLDAE